MVREVVLDCVRLAERRKAHRYLAKMLNFPEYYGKNLDALFDCMSELSECVIILKDADAVRLADCYGTRVLKVMEAAAQENPNIRLVFEDDGVQEQ